MVFRENRDIKQTICVGIQTSNFSICEVTRLEFKPHDFAVLFAGTYNMSAFPCIFIWIGDVIH